MFQPQQQTTTYQPAAFDINSIMNMMMMMMVIVMMMKMFGKMGEEV